MKVTKNTEVRNSRFGDYYVFDIPDNCSVVILCLNDGTGLKPVSLLLPHQVYVSKVEKLIADNPRTKYVTVIPASSDNYIDLLTN